MTTCPACPDLSWTSTGPTPPTAATLELALAVHEKHAAAPTPATTSRAQLVARFGPWLGLDAPAVWLAARIGAPVAWGLAAVVIGLGVLAQTVLRD